MYGIHMNLHLYSVVILYSACECVFNAKIYIDLYNIQYNRNSYTFFLRPIIQYIY